MVNGYTTCISRFYAASIQINLRIQINSDLD